LSRNISHTMTNDTLLDLEEHFLMLNKAHRLMKRAKCSYVRALNHVLKNPDDKRLDGITPFPRTEPGAKNA